MSSSPTSSLSSNSGPRWKRELREADWGSMLTTTGVSAVFHLVLFSAFGMIVFNNDQIENIYTTMAIVEDEPLPIVETLPIQPVDLAKDGPDSISQQVSTDLIAESSSNVTLDVNDLDPSSMIDDFDSGSSVNLKISDQLSGRSQAAKAVLVRQFGGNTSSEVSVATGMRWLQKHQKGDGGWSFDHHCPDCDKSCGQPGSLSHCRTAATSLALLTYLGAGHTHQKGDYRKEIRQGLEYLVKQGKSTPTGTDFRGEVKANEGMYAQGISTLALCEVYALTKDQRYREPANGAVKFIVSTQNPSEGGWRYTANTKEAGDTSVVGWQVMALKSAQIGKLKVPQTAFAGITKFLDAVQSKDGSLYAYTVDEKMGSKFNRPAMTAAGLLCRIYTGWDAQNEGMKKGIEYLDGKKPITSDMYYNYYATQVVHHWGGPEWDRWNNSMRDHLVKTQIRDGHGAGSWNPSDPHGAGPGGRLYMTCLATMTLEVYYRHLPIYQRDKVRVEF